MRILEAKILNQQLQMENSRGTHPGTQRMTRRRKRAFSLRQEPSMIPPVIKKDVEPLEEKEEIEGDEMVVVRLRYSMETDENGRVRIKARGSHRHMHTTNSHED